MLTAPIERMLFGLSDDHVIVEPHSGQLMHPEALVAFQRLSADARDAGFDPQVVSGFRNFDRQRTIWNRKARGERPLLDSSGEPLDTGALSDREIVYAILRWSALPGGSRHHWGTDFDVVDRAAMSDNYQPQLTPQEVCDEGIFGPFHCWLDKRIAAGESYGLFRPYAEDRGGIAPERWHLSYAPAARELQDFLTAARLRDLVHKSDLALGETVCEDMDAIFERFVRVPERCYPQENT
ncbi:M15 family metallopeptidase [Microbulbifer guangxiensis]|uniref:M15 family metallopeptidase n=1 Tax=Microbulbifer guangxiensis TaxID=2904249 RepID=UPI001F1AC405|nr:M15 family metallopeptidase [Microbulbifer guangxiensis]